MKMKMLLVLGVIAAVATVRGATQDPRRLFRAEAVLVAVPVSVLDGNTPVEGLEAGDFELRDDGVVQEIAFIADATVPIDLTFVVDGSTSVVIDGSRYPRDVLNFRRDIERLPELLRPDDRVRVLTFDSWLHELLPWTSAGQVPVVGAAGTSGSRTLNDAVAVSLMSGPSEGRRRLVAVLVKGADRSSAVDTGRLLDLAGRTDAVLFTYVLDSTDFATLMPGAMDSRGNIRSTMIPGGRLPSALAPALARPRWAMERIQALERAAERTGGRPFDYDISAFESLRRLLEEFRNTYILYFSPSEESGGWHDLRVAVRRRNADRYTVRARSGYDAAEAAMDVSQFQPQVPASGADETAQVAHGPESGHSADAIAVTADGVSLLLARYDSGDFLGVRAELLAAPNLADVGSLLRTQGQRWIEAGPPRSAARRRTVAAALGLELARPSDPASGTPAALALPWSERRALIYWGAKLLAENLRVDDAERAWYLAAVASFQGMLQFNQQMEGFQDAPDLVDQAIARVPDEARHRWTRAKLIEYWLEVFGAAAPFRPDDRQQAYESAASRGDGDLRAEMQLHLVSRFLEANRNTDEALGPFVGSGRREAAKEALARTAVAESAAEEPFVVYMARFLRARIHDRLDQRAEAEDAYQSALALFPRAQSAAIALATLTYLRGDMTAARQLADSAVRSDAGADPWRSYGLGDYRRLPAYVEQMRVALRKERGGAEPMPGGQR